MTCKPDEVGVAGSTFVKYDTTWPTIWMTLVVKYLKVDSQVPSVSKPVRGCYL